MNAQQPGLPVALVAEDTPYYRQEIVALLERLGLRVLPAVDGRAAIRHLARERTLDLLVTDLQMPGATGFEVAEAWLHHGLSGDAIIMVTAAADSAHVRQRCAALGIRLLHKRSLHTGLAPAIRELLGRRRGV